MRGTTLLAVMALTGCSLAPKYEVPKVPAIPASFKESGPWQLAHPADTLPRGPWWMSYNDSELNRLEGYIEQHNPTIAQAVAAYDAAQAYEAEARAGLFPTVIAGGSMTTNRQSERRPLRAKDQPNQYPANTVDVQVSYDLDLWGRLRNTLAAQKEAAQASAGDLATIRLSMHAELANDYVTLRGLDAQEKLLAETVKVYDKALQVTQARYTGRISSGLDVARAQDQLQSAQAAETDVAAQRALYEHAIASLIGVPASSFSLPAQVRQIPVPNIPTGVPSTLLQRRPDIAAAERRVAAANSLVGVAKAAFYPDISLSALFGFQNTGELALLSTPYTFWTVGPQLAMPIFEGGLLQAQEDAAKAAFREAGESYRGVVLKAFQQVEDSLSNLRILRQELKQEEAAARSAQRAADMSMSLYRDGATSYLEVVVSQTAALQAEQTVLSLETRELQASVDLVRALGGGWSRKDLPGEEVVATAATTH
ncbi:MAG TPA: efflux transporter outer membrane subunit [Rhodopila sp.]|nr:efflux transporter outer membrane subunit [Rhodopila sp.]